jgi:hypothetical protein
MLLWKASGPTLGRRVVLASGQVAQPAFTPDGKWITYLRAQGDGFGLAAVPASGGAAVAISDLGSQIDARWRPMWMP